MKIPQITQEKHPVICGIFRHKPASTKTTFYIDNDLTKHIAPDFPYAIRWSWTNNEEANYISNYAVFGGGSIYNSSTQDSTQNNKVIIYKVD